MNRIALVFLLTTLAAASGVRAQAARNAAYLELGGAAILASFNYERRFTEQWFGRAGLSWITGETSEDTETTVIVPLTVSSVSRAGSNHHMEVGGGLTFVGGDRQDLYETIDDDEKVSNVFVTGILGYRYQKPAGGFQFRAALTPVAGGFGFAPWLGVSFGYAW